MPLIGASGAIAGVVAAYLMLHPRVKIWVLAFGRIPLRIPAWIVLALWIVLPVRDARGRRRGADLLGRPCRRHHRRRAFSCCSCKRRGVPLFDREIVTPRAVVVEQPSAVRPVEAPAGAALGPAVNSTDLSASAAY